MTVTVNSRVAGTFYTSAPISIGVSSVPSGTAPSGTVGANGALTLGTALGLVYSAGIFLYFPAGAVFSGSSAGSYWTVMSSTTVGVVYNNQLSGAPSVPSSLTSIVDAGPGAFTGVTTEQTAATLVVPGNLLGASGAIQVEAFWSHPNNANTKTPAIAYGGTKFINAAVTAALSFRQNGFIRNRTAASQTFGNSGNSMSYVEGATTGNYQSGSVDSSIDQNFIFSSTKAVATDYIVLEGYIVTIFPSVN
jgi:hypothetical protein